MALKVYQVPEGKKVIINNFLKHFFVAILIFLGYILLEFLITKTVVLDSELWVFIIMVGADLMLAGLKAAEEWNEEWAIKFKWFIVPFYEFLQLLINAIVKKFTKKPNE